MAYSLIKADNLVLKGYLLRLVYSNAAAYQAETKWVSGGPGEVRTLDLMTARQSRLGYLIDFAARLATLEHAKARREHSSGTDLVLVSFHPIPRAQSRCVKAEMVVGMVGLIASKGRTLSGVSRHEKVGIAGRCRFAGSLSIEPFE
jgi:hypothetical protein